MLQPRINRLAFQGEDAEDALMHPPQRLSANEPLHAFDADTNVSVLAAAIGERDASGRC